MKDLFERFESLTRAWGAEIGRSIAQRVVAERQADGEAAPVEKAAPRREPGAAPAAKEAAPPKILPGLTGRRRKPGEPPPKCGRPGCEKPSRTRGYCQTHYVQWLKSGR